MHVVRILESNPGFIEKYYGVEIDKDKEETIEKIAIKRNVLIKGGTPDIKRMSRMILQDIQKGKILETFEEFIDRE